MTTLSADVEDALKRGVVISSTGEQSRVMLAYDPDSGEWYLTTRECHVLDPRPSKGDWLPIRRAEETPDDPLALGVHG